MTTIELLGRFRFTVGGESIAPNAPKPRSLLALLALRLGSVATIDEIAEELWEGSPPSSMATTIQTYIMRLRNLMAKELQGPARTRDKEAKELLATSGNGYLLNMDDTCSDVSKFNQLVVQGRQFFENGEYSNASRALTRADRLWRGPALADVHFGRVLGSLVVPLEERRRAAIELRAQIDLRLGRHHSVVDELTDLASTDQTNEMLHAQLMLALHRCGRRNHALKVFHRLQTALRHDLGLEVSLWVHRLLQSILNSDPELESRDYVLLAVGSAAS
ncbi:AfsR/SARP family transcriptional regulator [Streptomyces sp. NPDC001139]